MRASSAGSTHVNKSAVVGIRKLGPGAAKPELARILLEDSEWEIRVQAARALGIAGDPEVLTVLEAALEDPNEFVRSAVAHALRNHGKIVGGETPRVPADPTDL